MPVPFAGYHSRVSHDHTCTQHQASFPLEADGRNPHGDRIEDNHLPTILISYLGLSQIGAWVDM